MFNFRPFLRPATALLAAFLNLAVACSAFAATQPVRKALDGPAPKSILFAGNSFFYYNNSMHNFVLNLARTADAANQDAYRYTSVTISGSGFDWHDMESYFKPNAIGRYSFAGDNEVVFNKFDKPFDAVIMMDCSQCPVHPKLKSIFHEYAKKHSDTALKYGARPVFFMSWAYKDKPAMTAQLAEEYTIAGNKNGVLVVPAGLAFAKAIGKRPELEFYQKDKRHPSLLGTYLAACTIYASIYGKSPVGSSYNGGVDDKTAAFLQEVAWDTVREYYGK